MCLTQKLDNAVGLNFNHLAGAAPAPSDVLGPRLIAAPQQQEAFVPPCFKFGSRSPLDTEAEQQAMDSYKPSQHDEHANAFSSTFNCLSLGNDHPGFSATSVEVEAASSDTGNVFLCSACSALGLLSFVNLIFAIHSPPLVLNVIATFLPYCICLPYGMCLHYWCVWFVK